MGCRGPENRENGAGPDHRPRGYYRQGRRPRCSENRSCQLSEIDKRGYHPHPTGANVQGWFSFLTTTGKCGRQGPHATSASPRPAKPDPTDPTKMTAKLSAMGPKTRGGAG